ncbi:MAG: D-glycerate dehydrogenase [Candidatus Pacebacteria bacterium]|nr:D-glycerate dehydrogenase [Candidatus Paceibacterota bacterium]
MKIYITRQIPEPALKILRDRGYEVTVGDGIRPPTKKEIIKALRKKQYDGVITLLTDPIDGDVFDAVPSAKIFANYAVGYNNIDVKEATKRGITVTNTAGNFSHTVGEHTIALLLSLASNVVRGDRFTRAGKYRGWDPMLFIGTDLPGKTFGIIGAGRIGASAAKMAHRGFGMKVMYTDIVQNEELENECGARRVNTIEELLKESDAVSLHVPLLDSTHHLINEKRLSLMKRTAYLINTSRGQVIDEKALVKALKEDQIAGAALDVYEFEPKITRGLARLQNVVLTPHIASSTVEARSEMSKIVAENVISLLEKGVALNKVNN